MPLAAQGVTTAAIRGTVRAANDTDVEGTLVRVEIPLNPPGESPAPARNGS